MDDIIEIQEVEIDEIIEISENKITKTEIIIKRACYICATDLLQQYKKDNNQQNDFEETVQKFPEMIRHDGQTKELCGPCYKNHREGIAIYQEKYPKWKYPKARE